MRHREKKQQCRVWRTLDKGPMKIFAIDIGNHRAKLAIISKQDEIVYRMHIPTDEIAEHSDAIVKMAEDSGADGIVIGSVVPSATEFFQEILSAHDPLILTGETPCGLVIGYNPPDSLGVDRLAAASGAYFQYGKVLMRTIMIVDAGSTITADMVNVDGVYLGGAILPGDVISLESLNENTKLLPQIEFEPIEVSIGSNTRECMLVGIRSAVIGAIEHLYKQYGDLRGENPFMLITGASAAWITPELSIPHMVDPDLVLIGLADIWSYNRK